RKSRAGVKECIEGTLIKEEWFVLNAGAEHAAGRKRNVHTGQALRNDAIGREGGRWHAAQRDRLVSLGIGHTESHPEGQVRDAIMRKARVDMDFVDLTGVCDSPRYISRKRLEVEDKNRVVGVRGGSKDIQIGDGAGEGSCLCG